MRFRSRGLSRQKYRPHGARCPVHLHGMRFSSVEPKRLRFWVAGTEPSLDGRGETDLIGWCLDTDLWSFDRRKTRYKIWTLKSHV